jgi:hypothetical protein
MVGLPFLVADNRGSEASPFVSFPHYFLQATGHLAEQLKRHRPDYLDH